MIAKLIRWSLQNRFLILMATVLLAAWVTVAAYTVRGSISGHLFLSPEQAKAAA